MLLLGRYNVRLPAAIAREPPAAQSRRCGSLRPSPYASPPGIRPTAGGARQAAACRARNRLLTPNDLRRPRSDAENLFDTSMSALLLRVRMPKLDKVVRTKNVRLLLVGMAGLVASIIQNELLWYSNTCSWQSPEEQGAASQRCCRSRTAAACE